MSLSKITFTKGQSGLGYALQGFSHYTGILFYNSNTPSGLTEGKAVIYQTSEAEDLGINSTSFRKERYHVDEYFRLNPQGVLYIGFENPSDSTFSGVTQLQNFSNGQIRQFGVFNPSKSFATSQVQALQTVAEDLEQSNKPASIVYCANMGTGSTSSYSDLTTLDSNKVSVVIGQDMAGEGYAIYTATTATSGTCVSVLGATLGVISKSKVSDHIGWRGAYNVSNGTELESVGFADGSLFRSYSESGLEAIDAKGYIFCVKETGLNGTWFSDSVTCTASDSDYNSIENNRTIDKAVRQVRAALLPYLNSPIKVNADGTLTNDLVQFYQTLGKGALENMLSNSEISALDVVINPNQNVVTNKTLEISISVVPVSSAKFINVKIGFAVSV